MLLKLVILLKKDVGTVTYTVNNQVTHAAAVLQRWLVTVNYPEEPGMSDSTAVGSQ